MKRMTAAEEFQIRRGEIFDRVKTENELINHRMTWLGTFQGLIFAAVTLSWNAAGTKPVFYIACSVGAMVAVSIGLAIKRANAAINKASADWDAIQPEEWSGLDSEGYRSALGLSWLLPGAFIPWLFLASWIGLLIASLALRGV